MRRAPALVKTSKYRRIANSTATCKTNTVTTVSTPRRPRRPTSMQTYSKGKIKPTEANSSHRQAKHSNSCSRCHHSSKCKSTSNRTVGTIVHQKKLRRRPLPHSKRVRLRHRPPRNFLRRHWSLLRHSFKNCNAPGVLEKNRSLRSMLSFRQ